MHSRPLVSTVTHNIFPRISHHCHFSWVPQLSFSSWNSKLVFEFTSFLKHLYSVVIGVCNNNVLFRFLFIMIISNGYRFIYQNRFNKSCSSGNSPRLASFIYNLSWPVNMSSIVLGVNILKTAHLLKLCYSSSSYIKRKP